MCLSTHIYMYSKKTIANNSSPPSTSARTRTRTHTTRHDTAHSSKESKKFSDTSFVRFHTVLCKSTLLLVKHKVLAIKNNPNALSAQFMCIGSSSFHRIWVEDKAKQPRRYRTHSRTSTSSNTTEMYDLIWLIKFCTFYFTTGYAQLDTQCTRVSLWLDYSLVGVICLLIFLLWMNGRAKIKFSMGYGPEPTFESVIRTICNLLLCSKRKSAPKKRDSRQQAVTSYECVL